MGRLKQTNIILLAGSLVEQASMSETGDGRPLARFWLRVPDVRRGKDGAHQCRDLHVLCIATGDNARKLHHFGRADSKLLVSGRLAVLNMTDAAGDPASWTYIDAVDIGFTRTGDPNEESGTQ